MKVRSLLKFTAFMLFASISPLPASSQSVKYNGDIEVGVVATRKYATAQIDLSTTHGAYFTRPRLFVGAGGAIGWNIDGEFWNKVYPVYGDIRKDFSINRLFSAFIDAKLGYSFQGDHSGMDGDCGIDYGLYCYPSAGLRFAIGQQNEIYLKVGYTYQNATFSYLSFADEHKFEGSYQYNAGGFSASIGFSF